MLQSTVCQTALEFDSLLSCDTVWVNTQRGDTYKMGYFSAKATCAICGKEVGLNRYRMNNMSKIAGKDIWKCPQCNGYYGRQPMQYDPVSDRVTPVTANVDYSGQWGASANDTNTVQNPIISQPVSQASYYPIVKLHPKAEKSALLSSIGAIVCLFGSVFLPRYFTDLFGNAFVGLPIITVMLAFLAILSFQQSKKKAYVVNCPSCGNDILFPVTDLGCTCQLCQKRLVMKNGIVNLVD